MNEDEFKDRNRKRGLIKRSILIDMLGGKCARCGYNKNHSALNFHHIDPQTKKFQIDVRKCNNTKMSVLIEEANKCELLCANCHMEEHHPESDTTLIEKYKEECKDLIRSSTLDPNYDSRCYCLDCGKEISKGSTRCNSCAKKLERVVDRPSKEDLFNLVKSNPFTKVGEMFGVTDNTIRKWCRSYGLPSTKKELKELS